MVDVLLVSNLSERYYYDAFVRACEKIGLRVGVLDPEHFVETNARMHLSFEAGNVSGFLDVIGLGNDTNTVLPARVEDIRVAWYLRVQRTRHIHDIENAAERFAWSESLCALETLYALLPCRWVNTHNAIEKVACNKLLQQQTAHKVGLKTPRTVVSNVPSHVVDFSRRQGDLVLLKSIGYVQLDAQDELVLYSELFGTQELEASTAAIKACPVYAQEYVQKKFEYRVMVIGEDVLACRIDSQASSATRVDWRHYDFERVEHSAASLPKEINERLVAFMKASNLAYGAIDLIETPSGEYVFLEVNPSGQWEWIAQLANLPIADTVARMLASP